MPTYIYKCPITKKAAEFILPMSHEFPTYGDLVKGEVMDEKECKKIGVSLDDKLQRVYTPAAISWGGVRGTTEKPTDSSSATKEKNEKLKKLYKDSIVPDL